MARSAYVICMIRLAFCIALLASPAAAWEFNPQPICTISHQTDEVDLAVTFDPATAIYEIRLTLVDRPWPSAPVFAIQFDGPAGLTISTDRHQLSSGNKTLSVTDTGFGNVLNGLGLNRSATLLLGDRTVGVALDGAADPVEEFRSCARGLAA